jgi:hypothetical protein
MAVYSVARVSIAAGLAAILIQSPPPPPKKKKENTRENIFNLPGSPIAPMETFTWIFFAPTVDGGSQRHRIVQIFPTVLFLLWQRVSFIWERNESTKKKQEDEFHQHNSDSARENVCIRYLLGESSAQYILVCSRHPITHVWIVSSTKWVCLLTRPSSLKKVKHSGPTPDGR